MCRSHRVPSRHRVCLTDGCRKAPGRRRSSLFGCQRPGEILLPTSACPASACAGFWSLCAIRVCTSHALCPRLSAVLCLKGVLQPPSPPPPGRGGVTPQVGILGPQSRRDGGVHLDAPGERREPLPSSVWTRHGAVEQGQSGGCVGIINRGRGRGCRGGGVRIGQAEGGRARRGERPMGTAAYGGAGKWREANRCRPLQTATQPGVMPHPPAPFRTSDVDSLLVKTQSSAYIRKYHPAHLLPLYGNHQLPLGDSRSPGAFQPFCNPPKLCPNALPVAVTASATASETCVCECVRE